MWACRWCEEMVLTGVLEYHGSDRSDVSDKSDGRVGMQSATRQQ